MCALPLPCSKQRGARLCRVYTDHMADSAELARIKSTPTDTALATQIDEVESKVRVRCPSYAPTIHVDRVYACFNRSQNSANTSSLCAAAPHSSQQPSSRHSTQSGRGGAPNGFGGERCFTSARISVSSTLSLYGSEPAPNARLTSFMNEIQKSFWALVSDPLPPPDAAQLAEDLGIEYDTPEHLELERGPLCAPANASKRR